MKYLLSPLFFAFCSTLLFAQTDNFEDKTDDDNFFHTEKVYELIGGKQDAVLLFVGEEVSKDSVVNSSIPELWEQLDSKADFVIVFSEEMKKAVSGVSATKVILAEGDYPDYFAKVWNSMKKWLLIEFTNGDSGSFVSSPDSFDLVNEQE